MTSSGEELADRVGESGVLGEEGWPVDGGEWYVGLDGEGIGVCGKNMSCDVEVEENVGRFGLVGEGTHINHSVVSFCQKCLPCSSSPLL